MRSKLSPLRPGRPAGRLAALLLTVAGTLLAAVPARAEPLGLGVGEAQLLHLPDVPETVFVADPEVASIKVTSARRVLLTAKGVGTTTFYALGKDGDRVLVERRVEVRRDLEPIRREIRRVAPYSDVEVRALGDGVVLTGQVDAPQTAQRLVDVVEGLAGGDDPVRNHMTVQAPLQVNLRVRVAEMSRAVSRRLGFNWQGLLQEGDLALGLLTGRPIRDGGGIFLRDTAPDSFGSIGAGQRGTAGSLDAVVDALAQENLITVLAEPNLTAMSGETASFLAGGEFPIPVGADDGETQIEFREFGVRLKFKPTVRSRDRINLQIRTEVSEITDTGSVQTTNGIRVPGLRTNRAETGVEMASGQSFAIAGLLQQTSEETLRKFPGLGDVPVLGGLFRSTDFRRDQTELVVLVTPYVVRPARRDRFALPQDGYTRTSQLERMTGSDLGRSRPPAGAPPPRSGGTPDLQGPAGFAY